MFENIVVGLDGSDGSLRALDQALQLASLTHGAVHAVMVEEHIPAYAATVGEVDDEVQFENEYYKRVQTEATKKAAGQRMIISFEILRGHAGDQLARAATSRKADLLVIGHKGHSRLHHMLLGSTADRVVEHAPCPVLVVR
jgi:nucleotide-binding universal stress UspA family protein